MAFAGHNNKVVIANCFQDKILHIVDVCENESSAVLSTKISETYDLLICIKEGSKYKLILIDLEMYALPHEHEESRVEHSINRELIFEYEEDEVRHKSLTCMHIRGSSRKEAIDTHHELFIFLLHETRMYCWTKSPLHQNNQFSFVDTTSDKIKILPVYDDSCFFYIKDTFDSTNLQTLQCQEIKQVQINFNFYSVKTIFKEESMKEGIVSFNIDQAKHKLIMLSRNLQETNLEKASSSIFKFYDIENQILEFKTVIEFEPLIGRLESGNYTFVNGYIYYNNNVIKIRYDLIAKSNQKVYKENEIFDYYFNIFQLKEEERVQAKTPMDSVMSHRFGYVISNSNFDDLAPQRVLIVPYLHDKRIYLHRQKPNNKYFYTSIETYVEEGMKNIGKSRDIQRSDTSLTAIVCLNQTEYMYHIYSQKGVLIN